ncbi:hypothetical protein [Acidipila sp. EB88]|uniref:hypothetical protein n=1 Tax=Acidipila sp. EB88 TaxID=2305226 RepID=UPI000F5E6D30|nr:hypothetical protein [Acidipila sp. EB88]RRA49584.1 hypothetical protein D1Y84_16200 [Acidipila sp. EB88]
MSFYRKPQRVYLPFEIGNPVIVILAVGWDASVLDKRCAILEGSGYFVIKAYGENDALTAVSFMRPHLVLLCHTVKRSVQDSLAIVLRERQPALSIIQLTQRHMEPEALLTFVKGVLYDDGLSVGI